MRILVTGGAGFIGINLTLKLLKLGHEVTIIDNFITSEKAKINVLRNKKNWQLIVADIGKKLPTELRKMKFNQIYHLACPTGVPNLIPLAEEMLLTSSLGTLNILELAKKNKAKVLFTSSSEVYGDPKEFPQDESYTGNVDCIGIRSPYEEGKRFAESMIAMYVKKYGLTGKIVRIFNTYGPYMSLGDYRVVPRFLFQAIAGEPLTINGDGKQKRTFCYVDDLVNGLLLIMDKGTRGEVYNLGSDEEITIEKLARLIIKITKSKSMIKYLKPLSHDPWRRLPNLNKVTNLRWRRYISLEEGLRLTRAYLGHE
ncbi:hypothetical protein A3D78_07385 [Candidatus Gottesmanbacteria bacterium RIFCSPHIGHO2_02_FULL_39_14]|uniref:NAD-dependent epimerase/dehydratase domain-containing protein n=1 Tax=Candidatus Gottesmanbacteria bacterium RIFCSPHIGHO2_02_FULL_39_14 TaxID=1798383 RepID=A0A1F5ZZT2_9BACT|nr:MAG: hypothetical protein A3D78_07385 [Candidatus Gottesmanbacteria bacterium RIFCSPHIGHO2_02_FULL_39_14]